MENLQNLSNEDLLKAVRIKGEADFFYFAKVICEFGENPNPNGPKITEDQHELCDFLQAIYENNAVKIQGMVFKSLDEETKKKRGIEKPENIEVHDIDSLILCPRGTLKSTVLQAFALWIACKNPDVRILFYGEVHEQAQKRLAVLKQVITSCRTFKLCYGLLDGSLKKLPWNENIAVLGSRKNMSIREATFETAGLDVVVNSRHFDWIFPDDLHSEKNTGSKDQIENVSEKVRLLTPLLDEGSKMVFAGVFWNDSDFHSQLVESGKCNTFIRACWKDEKKTESSYPHVWSTKTLKSKRDKMSDNEFSCHYELKPISSRTQMFPRVRFRIGTKELFRPERVWLLIDPAGDPTSENSERRDSDYYGMEVWGINDSQDFMLLDGVNVVCGPTEAIEYAISFIVRYSPFVIAIERAAMANMKSHLEEELRKRRRFAICDDLLPNGRSKLMRVSAMEPYVRLGRVYIADDCPIKEDFLDQVTRISVSGIKAKHDDLIDPFGYIPDVIRKWGMPDSQKEDNYGAGLENLDERSREYWMAIRKKERAPRENWAGEFAG